MGRISAGLRLPSPLEPAVLTVPTAELKCSRTLNQTGAESESCCGIGLSVVTSLRHKHPDCSCQVQAAPDPDILGILLALLLLPSTLTPVLAQHNDHQLTPLFLEQLLAYCGRQPRRHPFGLSSFLIGELPSATVQQLILANTVDYTFAEGISALPIITTIC